MYGAGNEGLPAPKTPARKRKADEPTDEELDFKVSIETASKRHPEGSQSGSSDLELLQESYNLV